MRRGRPGTPETTAAYPRHLTRPAIRRASRGSPGVAVVERVGRETDNDGLTDEFEAFKAYLAHPLFPDLHEVKTGLATANARLKQQALKDVLLVSGNPKKAASITWHFFASDASSTIGPTAELLDYFDQLATDTGVTIIVKIWLP